MREVLHMGESLKECWDTLDFDLRTFFRGGGELWTTNLNAMFFPFLIKYKACLHRQRGMLLLCISRCFLFGI